jgi:hypothetical protein
MTNAIVYSFKGYDTAKHCYILRPAKATLERIRRIDDAVAVAGSGEELPPSVVDGDGFRRPAPNEGCGCPCADDAKSANSPPRVPGAHVAATGSFGREN